MRPVITRGHKKPPACDQCKAKRVLCHPQPVGQPCPRCAEKGIICTTTPVKRRRKGSVKEATPKLPDPGNLQASAVDHAPAISSAAQQAAPPAAAALAVGRSRSGLLALPAELIETLINGFLMSLQRYHPLVPFESLKASLKTHSYCLWLMPPRQRCLTLALIAYTSLRTVHPSITGFEPPGSAPPPIAKGQDLRPFGLRRDQVGMSRFITEQAFLQAKQEHIAFEASLENAATCWFLSYLYDVCPFVRSDETRLAWSSAFAFQIRSLQWTAPGEDIFSTKRLHWSGYLCDELTRALLHARPVALSIEDELLLVGDTSHQDVDYIDRLPPPEGSPSSIAELWNQVYLVTTAALRVLRRAAALLSPPYNVSPIGDSALHDLLSRVESLEVIVAQKVELEQSFIASPEFSQWALVLESSMNVLSVISAPVYVALYNELCARRSRGPGPTAGPRRIEMYHQLNARIEAAIARYLITFARGSMDATPDAPQHALNAVTTIALNDKAITDNLAQADLAFVLTGLKTALCAKSFAFSDHDHLVDQIDARLNASSIDLHRTHPPMTTNDPAFLQHHHFSHGASSTSRFESVSTPVNLSTYASTQGSNGQSPDVAPPDHLPSHHQYHHSYQAHAAGPSSHGPGSAFDASSTSATASYLPHEQPFPTTTTTSTQASEPTMLSLDEWVNSADAFMATLQTSAGPTAQSQYDLLHGLS